jgi:hypothetical protein
MTDFARPIARFYAYTNNDPLNRIDPTGLAAAGKEIQKSGKSGDRSNVPFMFFVCYKGSWLDWPALLFLVARTM